LFIMNDILKELELNIEPADTAAILKAHDEWFSISKPLGSLGELEVLVEKLAGIFGDEEIDIKKRCVLVACADNGVVEEGISQVGNEVTASVAREICLGKSNVNVMAAAVGADVYAIDMGMASEVNHPGIINCRISSGTSNISKGPAMTRNKAIQAIKSGINIVSEMKKKGYRLIVTGEMGIGNTTTSSAIASVLTGMDVKTVTGKGAGLSDEALGKKIEIIKKAIEVNGPFDEDVIDVLSKLGGYDIAAMTGMFLGGAMSRLPVLIDGLISSVAALIAYKIAPISAQYMVATHMTGEPAGKYIMKELGLRPIIDASLRLGEGTGAICMLPIMDIALAEYKNAHRFKDTDIEQYVEQ